jgi:hypothetical protein
MAKHVLTKEEVIESSIFGHAAVERITRRYIVDSYH